MYINDRIKANSLGLSFLAGGVIIGLLILKTGGLISLALLVCLFVTILLICYPIIAILAVLAGTTFIQFPTPLPFTNIGSVNIPDLILYLLFCIVIFKSIFFKAGQIVRTPLDIPLLLFVGVGFANLIAGTLLHSYSFFQILLKFKVMLYYLLALVITNIIFDKKQLKILIYGSLFLGIIAASQVILRAWISPPTAGDVSMATFYRYHDVTKSGILMYWTLITFLSLVWTSKIRLPYAIGTATSFFALILTFSRHWWISFVFSFLSNFALVVRKYTRKILAFLIILFILMFLVVSSQMLNLGSVSKYLNLVTLRLNSLTSTETAWTQDVRMVENNYALRNILAHPLYGIGFVTPYRPQIYGPDDDIQWFVHNGYLWILLKMGILGFIPFVWFSYLFIKRGIKHWKHVDDNFFKGIVLGSACSYLGAAVANLAAPHFMENWEVAVFGLCFGINEVIYRIDIESKQSQSNGTIRIHC